VGNDVLDLSDPRLQRAGGHSRFMERVFDPGERVRVQAGTDLRRSQWSHWAAKEAGFKAISKAFRRPPVFEHRQFVVHLSEELTRGVVRYREWEMTLRVEQSEDSMHALAWAGARQSDAVDRTHSGHNEITVTPDGRTRVSAEAAALLTTSELATIQHDGSAWSRVHIRRALATHLGQPESAIRVLGDPESPGRAPARLILEGSTSPPDITLSHHGRWVAWAFLPD
jgi:phosphopantetheinyl transferase (holo-ACP synthase)